MLTRMCAGQVPARLQSCRAEDLKGLTRYWHPVLYHAPVQEGNHRWLHALQLFLGETNRTISETPLNMASSRSHCIFTLHVDSRKVTTYSGT